MAAYSDDSNPPERYYVDQCVDSSLPTVFQCGKCQQIIGDTTSFVQLHGPYKLITIQKIHNMVIGKELITSNLNFDRGSTYVELKCKDCGTKLGRTYKCTPKHLDNIRNMFTLDITCINTYEIGSGIQNEEIQSPSLSEQVEKIQSLLLVMSTRLQLLEGSQPDPLLSSSPSTPSR